MVCAVLLEDIIRNIFCEIILKLDKWLHGDVF